MQAVTVALGRKVHRRARNNAESNVALAGLRIRPFQRHAVIEVGIGEPGQMFWYAHIVQPDITIVTSIGSEHNRSLKTLEVTRSEKAEMVRILPSSGLAVFNGDDPNVLWMRGETRARVITFGFAESNDVRATDFTYDWPNGSRFKVHANSETRVLRTRLIGRHMVYPILAAVAVSLAEGFNLDEVIPALETLEPTPGRMQTVPLANGAIILRDDYKSSLETIDAALDAFSEIPAGRRIVVLGEVSEPPGSQGPIYRRLGERIAEIASRAIFVAETKTFKRYSAGAKSQGWTKDKILHAGKSVLKVVEDLRKDLGPGDVVLVKGRDNQRLERISLALRGRTVRCELSFCDLKLRCDVCPMLERGHSGDVKM